MTNKLAGNNLIVANALAESGLKQKEFSERCGISRSHLSMIVAGTGKASNSLTELVSLKFLSHPTSEKEDTMYRLKYEESQDKLIAALEEISYLKELLLKKDNSRTKKVG